MEKGRNRFLSYTRSRPNARYFYDRDFNLNTINFLREDDNNEI